MKPSNNLLLPKSEDIARPGARISDTSRQKRPPLPDVPAWVRTPAEHIKLLWPGLEDGSTEHPWGVKTIRWRNAAPGKQEKALRVLFPRPPKLVQPGQAPKRNRGKPREQLLAELDALAGKEDVDVSLSMFSSWRRLDSLRSLTCLVLDFDVLRPDPGAHLVYADTDACLAVEQAVQRTLAHINAQEISAPNLVVRTGRGFHLYWLFKTILPAQAHPRWRVTQEHLIKKMSGLACRPDVSCSDATRVFRIVGTKNTKVRDENSDPWTVSAEVIRTERHSFDDLANQINPLTRRQCVDIAEARARRLAKSTSGVFPAVRRGPEHFRAQHARQIERSSKTYQWVIDQVTSIGKIDRGARDTVLFAAGCCLAWMVPPDQLPHHIEQFAGAYLTGMAGKEAVGQRMITVIQRAQQAAKAELASVYDDLRYVLSAKWFAEHLSEVFGKAVHQVKAFSGRRPRATGEYTKTGVRATHLVAALQAHQERAGGATLNEIAESVGVSIKTVHTWLKVPEEQIQAALDILVQGKDGADAVVLPKSSLNGSCPPENAGNLQEMTRGGSGGDLIPRKRPVDNLQEGENSVIGRPATLVKAPVPPPEVHGAVELALGQAMDEQWARRLPVVEALQRAGFVCKRDLEHRPRSADQVRWYASHPTEPWVFEIQVKADHAWYVAPASTSTEEVLSGYGGLWAVRKLLKLGYQEALERVGCKVEPKKSARTDGRSKTLL